MGLTCEINIAHDLADGLTASFYCRKRTLVQPGFFLRGIIGLTSVYRKEKLTEIMTITMDDGCGNCCAVFVGAMPFVRRLAQPVVMPFCLLPVGCFFSLVIRGGTAQLCILESPFTALAAACHAETSLSLSLPPSLSLQPFPGGLTLDCFTVFSTRFLFHSFPTGREMFVLLAVMLLALHASQMLLNRSGDTIGLHGCTFTWPQSATPKPQSPAPTMKSEPAWCF